MNTIKSLIDKFTKKIQKDSGTWISDARKAIDLKHIDEARQILNKGLLNHPRSAEGWLLLGEVMMVQADSAAIVSTYQSAIHACPESAELHFKLGCVMQDSGQVDQALASYVKAAELKAGFAMTLNNIGCLLLFRGETKQAEHYFRQAVESDNSIGNAHYNLSYLLLEHGSHEEALNHFGLALITEPDSDETISSLIEVLAQHKLLEDAETALRNSLANFPESYGLLHNLGRILQLQGRHEEAIKLLAKAAEIDPTQPRSLVDMGEIYYDMGKYDLSASCMLNALELAPDSTDSLFKLGCSYFMLARAEEAAQVFKKLVRAHPENASAFANLGAALMSLDLYEEAENCLRKAIELAPDNSGSLANLAVLLQQQAEHDEAMRCHQRAITLNPSAHLTHSNMLLGLNYIHEDDPQYVFAEHIKWAQTHANIFMQGAPFLNTCNTGRKLRIAYVSPDFRQHSVAYFIEPILEHQNKEQFEIHCYSDVRKEDGITLRLKKHAHQWHHIAGIPDEAVAQQIREDGIDILVDLSGHTSNNRLLVFARRAAPVQVTYLGYPNTTGLGMMDYRLSDGIADPAGETDRFHSENLLRLPNTFLCYRPSSDCPETTLREYRADRTIMFASFNNYAKVTPKTVALWAEILLAVPESRLIIKSIGLGNQQAQEKLLERFANLGVTPNRLSLHGPDPLFKQHIARYADIDIALDTYPYSGTTTTCEALWMGVPVVTRTGKAHASRVGASLLTAIGLQDLIADSDPAYLEKAIALANDASRLQELRQTLRARMKASPLMDETGFTLALEQTYKTIWEDWCKANPSPC